MIDMATPDFLKTRAATGNRFRLTKVFVDDFVFPGRRRYGLWRKPNIDMSDYDRYVVKESDLNRIDLIAYRMYSDSSLWWAICLMNNLKSAFDDLSVGQVLKIPKFAAISNSFVGSTVE